MSRHDDEYLQAWDDLSPELRDQMRAAGINGPELNYTNSKNPYYSGALLNKLAVDPQEIEPSGASPDERVCEAVRRVVGELLCQSNQALAIECFSLVTGLGYIGDSMTEIGHRHGVTRAAVSKRCIELADALGLDPSRAMRKKTSPKRLSLRRPEAVHPHINRIVSTVGRLKRSGWIKRQGAEQIRCLRADLEPIRCLCAELDQLAEQKESL